MSNPNPELPNNHRTESVTDLRAPKLHGSPFESRAHMVVQCALEILGKRPEDVQGDIHLPMSVAEFGAEFQRRYAATHPDLAFRTPATFERARLDRRRLTNLPRVILRQGPPPLSERRTG